MGVKTALAAEYEEPVNLTTTEKKLLRSLIIEEIQRRKGSSRTVIGRKSLPTPGSIEAYVANLLIEQLETINQKLYD